MSPITVTHIARWIIRSIIACLHNYQYACRGIYRSEANPGIIVWVDTLNLGDRFTHINIELH